MRNYLAICIVMLSVLCYTDTLVARPNATSNESYAFAASHSNDNDEEIIYAGKNTKKKKKKKSFNAPKTDDFWGVSAGYVSKVWSKESNGTKTNAGLYGGDWLHGIQFGLRFNPQFKYGFGMNIGLLYEYYHNKSALHTDGIDENGATFNYNQTLNEHVLRLPLYLEYRLNFSKAFQLFFYGGLSVDYVVSGTMEYTKEGNQEPYHKEKDIYGSIIPSAQRYNVSLIYGGGIRFNAVQFNVNSEMGLINLSPSEEYIIKQNNPLSISLSIMF